MCNENDFILCEVSLKHMGSDWTEKTQKNQNIQLSATKQRITVKTSCKVYFVFFKKLHHVHWRVDKGLQTFLKGARVIRSFLHAKLKYCKV